jgi:hypothetical protein
MRTKVQSQLEKIFKNHGSQEFGKICQIFLGLCLLRLKFQIQIFQLSGRPDIVAIRDDEGFAFEVKTTSGPSVTIKSDDIDGVKGYSEHSIIAVQSFPDLECNWILCQANKIRAGKWPIPLLKQYSLSALEKEVDNVFPEILEESFDAALKGTQILYNKFTEVRERG